MSQWPYLEEGSKVVGVRDPHSHLGFGPGGSEPLSPVESALYFGHDVQVVGVDPFPVEDQNWLLTQFDLVGF